MEPFDVDARELAVEVAAVRWRAPDSDFAVVVGITEEGEEVVAVGALGHVHEGEEVELAGAWQEHARHGWRFAARQARLRPPSSEEALLAYLASIKHVGPRGAQWLLDHHGPGEVLAAIDRDPEGALRGVPGIGPARIGPAVHAWEEQGAQRAVRLLLEEHGVPGAVAARVYRTFGPGTMELLRTDPYRLTDVEGIGFVSADALAQALGTAHDDPGRLDAGLRHALREAERDGHCHLPRSELEHRAARLLGEDASRRVDALATAGRLVVDGDRVLHPAMARAEGNLARHVRELLEDEPALRLGEVERPTGHLAPSDDQWSVVETVLARRLAILTGGPGTGKCIAPESLVVADGTLEPIAELWDRCATEPTFDGEGFWATPNREIRVPAVSGAGRVEPAPVSRLYRQRVNEIGRRVILSDGSTLVMTNRHRLLGLDGWKRDLAPGDWVCVPRTIPWNGPRLPDDLTRLLAWKRFGVWMRSRIVEKAATNGRNVRRPYVTGTISGPSLRAFAIEVGFADLHKEARLFDGVDVPAHTDTDLVPISDLLRQLKAATGLSRHYFGLSSSYFTGTKEASREVCTRVVGRVAEILDGTAELAHAARVAALSSRAGHRYKFDTRRAFDSMDREAVAALAARLRERVERDVSYCRIRSVDPVPLDGWVYDLEIRGPQNYVAGGMICHNTATMRALVGLLKKHKRTVRLCAPTGKAARRLSETTGAPATTIHRLLEYQVSTSPPAFARDADDPIPGTDLLVVDEASMLDVRLAQALFAAIGPKTHVLLVGDPDQLASVGPGRVLDDLLESGAVPTVRLTEIFRQAARSLIVRAAHAIDAGEPPPTAAGPQDVRDFFLVTRTGADAIREEVVALAGGRLAGHLGVDPRSGVLVLAPMHRGPAGIDVLNDRLRALLNPEGTGIGGSGLRVGDRVIQTVNDHEHELMNGELGVLEHHDRDRDRVLLACDDGRRLTLPARVLGTLRLAHAISIHKAQGSQAPGIVVVLHRGHSHMLTRNLLYTAVTRAERACVVVGEPAALHAALGRRDSHARHTRLRGLIA